MGVMRLWWVSVWPCRAKAAGVCGVSQGCSIPKVQHLQVVLPFGCHHSNWGKSWWRGFLLAFLRRVSPGALSHSQMCLRRLGKAQPVPVKPCQGSRGETAPGTIPAKTWELLL